MTQRLPESRNSVPDKRKRDLERLCRRHGLSIIEAAETLDGLGSHSPPADVIGRFGPRRQDHEGHPHTARIHPRTPLHPNG